MWEETGKIGKIFRKIRVIKETFSEFWRNSLKLRKKMRLLWEIKKPKNKNYSPTCGLVGNRRKKSLSQEVRQKSDISDRKSKGWR